MDSLASPFTKSKDPSSAYGCVDPERHSHQHPPVIPGPTLPFVILQ
jgi:hypothetical protein